MRRTRTIWSVARRAALLAAIVALLFGLGNVGPSEQEPGPRLDVVVAVDTTTSMSALDDPAGSRITAVRRDLAQLAAELGGGSRISVATFGREARLLLPLSPDDDAVAEVARGLQVEQPTVGTGTSVGDAVPILRRELGRADDAGEDQFLVAVLITDGENTRAGRQRSFAAVGDLAGASLVMGYGSDAGGVMPIRRVGVEETPPPPSEAGGLVPGPGGGPAVSVRDAGNLQTIADQIEGTYVPCDGTQDVAAVAAQLEEAAQVDAKPARAARELRWLWALLVLLLVLPELRLGWRQFLDARRAVRT